MNRPVLFLFLLLLFCPPVAAGQDGPLSIGAASGFPPFQFVLQGEPAGFDTDVARAVARRLGRETRFVQGEWDNVVSLLRIGRIDIIVGMEINEFRRTYFDFTAPYASRHDAVFVLADSRARAVEDLFGQIISGDRHSFVELLWREKGIHQRIRISQTGSKEEAMRLLAAGETAAAIMPLEVGRHLAREMKIDVRVLSDPDPGSDVAIALRKGQPGLKAELEAALAEIRASGELEAMARKWFSPAPGDASTAP